MMMPIVDEAEARYGERLQVVRIDVEKNPGTMERYEAEIIPTFILYKDDREVGKMAGMIGEKTIYGRIDRLFQNGDNI